MNFKNYKSVSREISEKYIDVLFKQYSIEGENSKKLRENILETCEKLVVCFDPDMDLYLVREIDQLGRINFRHISRIISEIGTPEQLVEYFSKIILENESIQISKFDFWKMQRDISYLKNNIENLNSRFTYYR